MSYAFGDSARAAARLALLARVFEPASAAFLAEAARREGALAVDLGCGPGHTTELLARIVAAERTVGLEESEAYVAAARERSAGRWEVLCHDVRRVPYPVEPASTIYGRFLLSHLDDPAGALDVFTSRLAPAGRLLLDEVEWIRSESPVFQRYLDWVEKILASRGQCLFVGSRLAELAVDRPGTIACTVRELPVAPRDAAGMFVLNWETLRESTVLADLTSEAEREGLAAELGRIAAGDDAPAITWGLRQVAIEA